MHSPSKVVVFLLSFLTFSWQLFSFLSGSGLPALIYWVGWKEADEQNEYFFIYLSSAHKLWQEMKWRKFYCWTWLKVFVSWITSMQSSWIQTNKANLGLKNFWRAVWNRMLSAVDTVCTLMSLWKSSLPLCLYLVLHCSVSLNNSYFSLCILWIYRRRIHEKCHYTTM